MSCRVVTNHGAPWTNWIAILFSIDCDSEFWFNFKWLAIIKEFLGFRRMSDMAKKPRLSFDVLENLLECSDCMCTFHQGSPIFQCGNGHIFCSDCHSKVLKCPQCQGSLVDRIRNLLAEQLLEKILDVLPDCPFVKHGCTAKLHPTTGELHKKGCHYRVVLCPLSSCVKIISLRYASGMGFKFWVCQSS